MMSGDEVPLSGQESGHVNQVVYDIDTLQHFAAQTYLM